MKKAFIALSAMVALSPVLASAGQLDGLKFCRTIQSDGLFGQPAGTRTHCVSFKDDVARDDANTFFGNPPDVFGYFVEGDVIMNAKTRAPSGYVIQGNDIMIAETATVLMRQSEEGHN